jgi:hypothetical protein
MTGVNHTSAGSIDAVRHYLRMRERQPLKGLDDTIHAIHTGTEYAAELRLSDLRAAFGDAAQSPLTRQALIDIIVRETTDEITSDGIPILTPNVLVQGCTFIQGPNRDGYDDPEAAALNFAGLIADAILAAQPPAAPVETATKSAPVLGASQNTAERLPSSDAAEAGADTHCSAGTTERAKAIVEEAWRQTCAGPGEFDDYAVPLIAAALAEPQASADIVERAAQAIYETWAANRNVSEPWSEVVRLGHSIAQEARDEAKAVLAVLNEPQTAPKPVGISIKPMALSDGSTDYYVALTVGKREITPYKFKEEWQAQYEADSFRWLFLGAPKPDLLAYGPTSALSRPQSGGQA